MKLSNICNKIIEFSFYALFLLVPLAFTSATSELFELNKMWLVWGLTVIIGTSWFVKMILQRKFFIQRTPLDIPIGLFLFSQIISTIFSLDPHVSLWGYYSRFNGGLLSLLTYIFLYYAFITFANKGVAEEEGFPTARTEKEHWREGLLLTGPHLVKRVLFLSLVSGLIVALWGLPSHFGYDPTCLLFRGALDVSCWTAEFLPKIRIFSTLGQPDWLAAYLAILIPISIAMVINSFSSDTKINGKIEGGKWKMELLRKINLPSTFYFLLSVLFYIDLLYTRARSGFLGIWLALIFFAALYYWISGKPKISLTRQKLKSPFTMLILGLLIITFIIGTPINQLNRLTLPGIINSIQKISFSNQAKTPVQPVNTGGTESANIRLNVWSGAINAWKANPIFGTGVETFAFAYYKYKPVGQNLTSEWNFLYNKAHNEYLNYLATTGIVGLGTYLSIIFVFLWISIKYLVLSIKQNLDTKYSILYTLALIASYVSILITNFFGFSVVIINVYFFMIPAFIFILTQQSKVKITPIQTNKAARIESGASVWQWTLIFLISIAGIFMLFSLFRFWLADTAFALGYNLDQAKDYQQAYPNLHKAVQLRGDEPVFKDELSLNEAIIATGLVSQKIQDSTASGQAISVASSLTQEAINISNEVISQHPNNAVFWKTRVKLFYALSQVDSRYLTRALDAIEKTSFLAPQDANIWYNLGLLYGQNNNVEKGISAIEKAVMLKPDYRDARYALGLFYHTQSLDKSGKVVIDESLNQKAIAQMQYILDHISSKDSDALKSIADWAK